MEKFSIFSLFLSFCAFYVYLEKKIEKEIKKNREDDERRERDFYKSFNDFKKEIKDALKDLKYELRERNKNNYLYKNYDIYDV